MLNQFFVYVQPFFVLHKASSRKSDKKSNGIGKTRRRIDLSQASPRKSVKLEVESTEDADHDYSMNLRLKAFHSVWSEIQLTIKVLVFYLKQLCFFTLVWSPWYIFVNPFSCRCKRKIYLTNRQLSFRFA